MKLVKMTLAQEKAEAQVTRHKYHNSFPSSRHQRSMKWPCKWLIANTVNCREKVEIVMNMLYTHVPHEKPATWPRELFRNPAISLEGKAEFNPQIDKTI